MDSDAPVTGLGVYDSFVIEVKPVTGASIALERTLPGRIDAVMDLN
jgi:archaellin